MLKSVSAKVALAYLGLLLITALLATVLANPENGWFVEFGPNNIGERNNTFEPPGFLDFYKERERVHPLGTDGRGRDVAAILIHGSKTSLLLGFFASVLSILFGTSLGLISAYYGNKTLKVHPIQVFTFIFLLVLFIFLAYESSWIAVDQKLLFSSLHFALWSVVGIAAIFMIMKFLSKRFNGKYFIPIDSIIMRFAEIFRAVPKLFLLLTVISFLHSQNLWTTTFLLGALGWSRILRLVRGEVMELKEQTYITNAKVMGLSDFRIISKHILPNVMPLLLVSMAFLISGNILIESTLSFLGLGLPLDLPSWGGLLRQSREDFGAWWLAVFPGLTITLTLFSLNILADSYNNSSKKMI